MFSHGPSCLKGPLSGARPGWHPTAPRGVAGGDDRPLPSNEGERRPVSVRRQLVERIRAELAAGVYETPEKWEVALDRLLRSLETA